MLFNNRLLKNFSATWKFSGNAMILMNLSFSLSENPCPSSCCLHFDSTFNSICLLVPFVSEDLVMKTCYFSDKLCVVGWKFSDLIVYFLSSSSLSSLSVWLERKRARKKYWITLFSDFQILKSSSQSSQIIVLGSIEVVVSGSSVCDFSGHKWRGIRI